MGWIRGDKNTNSMLVLKSLEIRPLLETLKMLNA
jgi:hypothetical protein